MGGGWRDFFYFSRSDRRVVCGLAGMLAGIALAALFFLWRESRMPQETFLADSAAYDAFFSGLQPADSLPTPAESYAQPAAHKPETFVFDPNTADSTALLRLGLSPWQVRNIYKYRARGGRYHRPEDFSKLYGLTKGDYDRLRPYIRIADEFRLLSDLRQQGEAVPDTVSPRPPRQEKYPEGTKVDLNAADTSELKKIPGIGSYYARRIVDYRQRLGGFASVGQLSEVEDLPQGLEKWFEVATPPTAPLYVNRLSLNALRRHPYLDFYQAKVIVEHRRKFGRIGSLHDLSLYEEFSPSDFERLQPYVKFEE